MRRGHTLLVDADDTLWENNIHFERVVQAYCRMMAARGLTLQQARGTLNAIERERTRINGYGIKNFHSSLRLATVELLQGADHAEEFSRLAELCQGLAREAMALLPEVRDTLRDLSGRHRVILLTKGDPDDQLSKVQRSGLRPYLHQVDVVHEKDAATYKEAIVRHGIRRPGLAWMIGNSPRSDILPALEAGLGAVFIPHASTWELELDELPPAGHPRLLVVDSFRDLLEHF